MSHYLTPIKHTAHKKIKSNTQNKAEDWICILCNNLNFSFRKKCNRCKTQTRLENQNHVSATYSQYYYEQDFSRDQAKSPLSDSTNLFTPQPKNQNRLLYKPKQNQVNLSKLAKQYCPKDIKTALEAEAQNTQKQFGNDFWQFINVRDFDEICQEHEQKADEEARHQSDRMQAQLERMFDKILLGNQ